MSEYMQVQSLDEFLDGDINERFQQEIQKIVANINDPITKAEKERSLVITIAIKPDKSRKYGEVTVNTKTKLAPPIEAAKMIEFGVNADGELAIFEKRNQLAGQIDMEGNEQPRTKIYSLNSEDISQE